MRRLGFVKPLGWTRLHGGKFGHWRHDATGWEIQHCGHPTANWPFSLRDPRRPGLCIVSFNGNGFVHLAVGFQVVERILAGELGVTTARCVPGIGRVLVTAQGEASPEEPATTATNDKRLRGGLR